MDLDFATHGESLETSWHLWDSVSFPGGQPGRQAGTGNVYCGLPPRFARLLARMFCRFVFKDEGLDSFHKLLGCGLRICTHLVKAAFKSHTEWGERNSTNFPPPSFTTAPPSGTHTKSHLQCHPQLNGLQNITIWHQKIKRRKFTSNDLLYY